MLERIQRGIVLVCGLTVFLFGFVLPVVEFVAAHPREIILHIVMGVMFALTGVFLRGMCEHLRHKIALGAVLIAAEAVITVALIG